MLKLSKRCKSLVVSLLLCGCLVGFSSVSFAEVGYNDIDLRPQDICSASSVIVPSGSNTGIGTILASIYTGSTVKVSEIIYPADSWWSGKYKTYFSGDLIISNSSNTDYMLDSSFIRLANLDFSVYLSNDSTSIDQDSIFISDFNCNPDYASVFGYSTNQITFRQGNKNNYIGSFYVPAHSSVTIPFSFSCVYQVNGFQNNEPNTTYARLSSFDVLPSGSATLFYALRPYTDVVPPPGISAGDVEIDSSIQSQTQQQQQQHEEQMQQQQEQYEDLTDPGTTEGEEFISGTDNAIKDKIGIFTFIDTLLENLLGLFVVPEGDPVLTLPGFSIEIAGERHQIWTDQTFNLASLDEDFSVLLTAVRFGTVAVVYFALINFLGDTYLRIFAGGKEDD